MADGENGQTKSAGPVDVEAIRKKLACEPPFSDAHLVGYFRVIVPALLARVEELEGALDAIAYVYRVYEGVEADCGPPLYNIAKVVCGTLDKPFGYWREAVGQ